jgi:hypothetical protein
VLALLELIRDPLDPQTLKEEADQLKYDNFIEIVSALRRREAGEAQGPRWSPFGPVTDENDGQ